MHSQDLESFSLFRHISAEGRKLLARGLIRRHCGRLSMVLCKGDRISGAYFVLAGRLRVFSLSPNGVEATLYFIEPGETCVLALNCLFNDLLYPAWVQAETETEACLIPGAIYRRLFEREPPVQDMTVRALSTIVFRLMSELELVHSSHQGQRLAKFILLHASADGLLGMTQQQLANHLGTSREVIARLIRDLVNKGCLETGRGMIRIKDLYALRLIVSPSAA